MEHIRNNQTKIRKPFIERHKVIYIMSIMGLGLGHIAVMVGAPDWGRKVGAGISVVGWVLLILLYVREVLIRSKQENEKKVQ